MGIKLGGMGNRSCFIALIFCITLGACSVQKKQQKADWINSYKRQVFISCLNVQNRELSKNDVSESINADILGNTYYLKQADSLGKGFYRLIRPSKILDHNNNRALVNGCLEYYESKQLDSMAKSAYKEYLTTKKMAD
jgi:hypothetical protein